MDGHWDIEIVGATSVATAVEDPVARISVGVGIDVASPPMGSICGIELGGVERCGAAMVTDDLALVAGSAAEAEPFATNPEDDVIGPPAAPPCAGVGEST